MSYRLWFVLVFVTTLFLQSGVHTCVQVSLYIEKIQVISGMFSWYSKKKRFVIILCHALENTEDKIVQHTMAGLDV